MNKASAFRIKQADGTYSDPIIFGLDKSEVWPSTKEIPENADLNDYKTPGAYCCPTNAAVATLDNAPTIKSFSLIVYRTGNSNSCVQYVSIFPTGLASQGDQDQANRIFTRTYYWGDDWSPWAEIATSLDRPVDYTSAGWTLGTYADHCWHKMATFRSTNTNMDRRAVFLVTDSYWYGTSAPNGRPDLKIGLLHVHIRKRVGTCATNRRLSFNLNAGYDPNDFVLVYNPVDDSDELWTRIPTQYDFRTFNLIETGLIYGGNRYYQTTANPIEMYRRVQDVEGYEFYPTGEGYVAITAENAVIEQPSRGIVDLGVYYNKTTTKRLTSANNLPCGDANLKYFNSTSSMTVAEGKPIHTKSLSAMDAHVLHLPWDNAGGYDAQIAVPNNLTTPEDPDVIKTVQWRAGTGQKTTLDDGTVIQTDWSDWQHVVDSQFTFDGIHPNHRHVSHYAVCSTPAATAVKTVDILGFQLVAGAYVIITFTNKNTAAVANLKLNVSNTGDIPIKYHNGNLVETGDLIANRPFMFVYDGTNWQLGIDIDKNTTTNYYDRMKTAGAVYPKENITTTTIIVNDGTGYFKLKAEPFNITYPILATGAAFTAGTANANAYTVYHFAIKNTQNFTMTQHAPVFIKGTLNGVMFTPVSNTPLVQALPNTEDGYQYIYLGYAYSTANIQLVQMHPIVEYIDGAIRLYQEKRYGDRILARLPDTSATPDDADYLENLFAKGRILLQPNAHYHLRRTVILPENIDIDMNGATIEYNGPGWDGPDEDHLSDTSNYNYTTGCAFLNVRDGGHPASASDPDRNITAYNGRGNMRFYNGTFMNCAFGLLHGHDISFEDITFTEVHTNHVFQICACKNVSFERCTFFGMDKTIDYQYTPDASNPIQSNNEVINLDCATASGQFIGIWFLEPIGSTNAATWDEYACREITVNNCTFRPNNDSIMFDAIGYHANFMKPLTDEVSGAADYKYNLHKNIRVTNNYFYGTKKSTGYNTYSIAFLIRHMMNSTFANNICENVRSLCLIDHVRNITITGNVATNNGENYAICQIVSTSHNSTLQGVANFKTLSKYLNISGNLGLDALATRIDTEDNITTIANRKIYKYAEWTPNTSAYPRFNIDGQTVTLYGRVKATASKTISSEESVMCLPVGLRPTTTVTWIQRIDTYGGSPANAAVLIKIFKSGEMSINPIGGSINVIAGSDLWLDGTYLNDGASYTYGG